MKVRITVATQMEVEVEDKFFETVEDNDIESFSDLALTDEGVEEMEKRYGDIVRVEEVETGKVIFEW